MRRLLLIVILICVILPLVAGALFLYSPLGVKIVAGQLHRLERAGVHIEGLSGTFAGPLRIARFELDHPRVHIVGHDIDADPQMRGLLLQTIRTRSLTARDITVELRPTELPPSDRPPRFLPQFMRIDARGVHLAQVRYVHVDGRVIEADEISGSVAISAHRLRVRNFAIAAERFAATGALRLTAASPLGIALRTQGTLQLQPDLDVALQATLDGNVDRMSIGVTIEQPSRIMANGLFVRTDEDWRITGTVTSPAFSLAPWLETPPFSFADIVLEADVTRDAIRTVGEFTVPEYSLVRVNVDAQGRFVEQTLHIDSSTFTLPGTPLRLAAQGSLHFPGGYPFLDLRARWSNLQWPYDASPLIESARGEAELRGTLPYQFAIRADVAGPNVPATSGSASGVINKDAIGIERYDIELLGGRASGQGTIAFAEPRAWTLVADARNLDIGALFAEMPGQVSFKASAEGRGLDRQADFKLALADLRGRLRGERLRGSGSIERRGARWDVRDASLRLGNAQLTLQAQLADTIEAQWQLRAPALERLLPETRGSITFSGEAHGARAAPHISASLRGTRLAFRDWAAAALTLDGEIDASNTQTSKLVARAERIGHGERRVDTVALAGNGTLLDHRITLDVQASAGTAEPPSHAHLELAGAYDAQSWQGSIVAARVVRGHPEHILDLAEPASLVLAANRAALDEACLKVANGQLCAAGKWQRNGAWEAKLSGYEIPLALVLPAPEPEVEYAGRIEGSAHAFGGPSLAWQGEAGMKISDVAIIYRPEGADPETLNLGTGGMHLVAASERITFSFGVQAFTDTFLHTNMAIERNGSNDILHLPLSGDVRARAADANLLPLLFPEVDRAAGVLTGTGRIFGTLAAPEFNGRIELIDGELDSYRANFALRDLDLVARIDGTALAFDGTANAGEGRLQVSGNLRWRDGGSHGQMRLRGNELLVADLPEYRVVASPDLQFDIAPDRIDVRGDVTIPSARIQPARLTGAVTASNDARYVGEHEAERTGRFKVNSEIRVNMGQDVRVDAFGLHARIEGGVTTRVRTGQATTGHGELRVAEGRYSAYGQQLEISRGQLLFDNAPLDDPGLDIEARRRIETVTVGLNVRGTLQEPRLTFFSDPSMSQTQIVSYLLVGKPISAGDTDAASSSTDSLALQGGGFLAAQLGRRLGLEEVGVEHYVNAQGEATPALVLGKFLSPRLFISYGISLTESINTLKLRYTISDRWVFRTESGEAQSADLEYTIER
jgi:translocation and assembly module TamB